MISAADSVPLTSGAATVARSTFEVCAADTPTPTVELTKAITSARPTFIARTSPCTMYGETVAQVQKSCTCC